MSSTTMNTSEGIGARGMKRAKPSTSAVANVTTFGDLDSKYTIPKLERVDEKSSKPFTPYPAAYSAYTGMPSTSGAASAPPTTIKSEADRSDSASVRRVGKNDRAVKEMIESAVVVTPSRGGKVKEEDNLSFNRSKDESVVDVTESITEQMKGMKLGKVVKVKNYGATAPSDFSEGLPPYQKYFSQESVQNQIFMRLVSNEAPLVLTSPTHVEMTGTAAVRFNEEINKQKKLIQFVDYDVYVAGSGIYSISNGELLPAETLAITLNTWSAMFSLRKGASWIRDIFPLSQFSLRKYTFTARREPNELPVTFVAINAMIMGLAGVYDWTKILGSLGKSDTYPGSEKPRLALISIFALVANYNNQLFYTTIRNDINELQRLAVERYIASNPASATGSSHEVLELKAKLAMAEARNKALEAELQNSKRMLGVATADLQSIANNAVGLFKDPQLPQAGKVVLNHLITQQKTPTVIGMIAKIHRQIASVSTVAAAVPSK